ncbi:DsbA family protein [Salinirubrum litoreum]|uniref:DsbA family protein n=1 Tax=Salinirubrum litoreum TaxID=1126234 RepID=A0ABD5RD55_9EURY|nr:thioredoxin domain-containing protein [Salinirubrum litoreum]
MKGTRRAYLSAVAAGAATALAGCLGGGSNANTGDCDIGNPEQVSEQENPALGNPDSSVTIQVFEDFSCPHCATYNNEIFPDVRADFVDTGDVLYQHHDLPLPVNERWSWKVPSAARAVYAATDAETFFEYTKAVFAEQGNYSMDVLDSAADDVGAPGCDARSAAINDTYRPVLEADRQRAIDMAGNQQIGTPAVFVNGSYLGSYQYADIESAIQQARG